MFSFNRSYILLIVFLLLAQTGLNFSLAHSAVYPILSNIILIVMLYAFLKTFWRVKPLVAGVAALLLASAVEIMPYLQLTETLMIRSSLIISAGNSLWATMLSYAVGILLALMTERAIRQAATPPVQNNMH